VSDLGSAPAERAEPVLSTWADPAALAAEVGAPFHATLLAHNPLNAVTGGIWRVRGPHGSVIVKVLTDGRHHDGPHWWAASLEDRHWNSWRREVLAYRTGLAGRFALDGVAAPELRALDERADGTAVLWLEDVGGRTGDALTVDDLVELAGRLGRAQGRLAVQGGWDEPWLSTGYLREYSASKPTDDALLADDEAWAQPLVAHHLGPLRPGLVMLRSRRNDLVDLAARCPTTLCHLDLWPANVVRRPSGDFALLDWAFSGAGALGEDIANLVPDSVFDLFLPAASIEALARGAEEAYVAGVRSGGWTGDERWVRLGMRAASAKYHWMVDRLLEGDQGATRAVYGGRTVPAGEFYAARAGALAVLCRWADEAFALAEELDA
jgi:hypothetical protein